MSRPIPNMPPGPSVVIVRPRFTPPPERIPAPPPPGPRQQRSREQDKGEGRAVFPPLLKRFGAKVSFPSNSRFFLHAAVPGARCLSESRKGPSFSRGSAGTWSPAAGAAAAHTAGPHVPRGANSICAVGCSGRRRLRTVQGRDKDGAVFVVSGAADGASRALESRRGQRGERSSSAMWGERTK
jgi:hypothetical protein